MPEIGVRELKTRASEIVRDVRDHRARYVVTYRGRPVGMLVPVEDIGLIDSARPAGQEQDAWDELTRLGRQIGAGWRSSLTSAELLSQLRR